jgi:hypothetical protein
MDCKELNGFTRNCGANIAGIQKVWIIPFDEINNYTYTNDDLNYITGYSSSVPTPYSPTKTKSEYSATQNRTNYRLYDHTLTLNFPKMEEAKRNELKTLEGLDITCIFKDNNGFCWIMGQDFPCKLVSTNLGTGVENGSNEYTFTITSTEKEHIRRIVCPSDDCFTSIVVQELIKSEFIITFASSYDWLFLELTGDENKIEYNTSPQLDPSIWLTDQQKYNDDVQQLQQIFESLGTVVNFQVTIDAFDTITITVSSSDTRYNLLNVDNSILIQGDAQAFLSFNVNLSPQIQTSGLTIRFTDSNGVLFEEPYGTTLSVPNINGVSQSFTVENLLNIYPTGTTFNLTLPDTPCSSLDFFWQLDPQIDVCTISNGYEYYKGNTISMRVPLSSFDVNTPRFQNIRLNFFGDIVYMYQKIEDWHNDFNQFVSDLQLLITQTTGVQITSIVDSGNYADITLEVDGIDVDVENPFYDTYARGYINNNNTDFGYRQSYNIVHKTNAPYPSLVTISNVSGDTISGENLNNILNNNGFTLDSIGVSQNQSIDNVSIRYCHLDPYEYSEASEWTIDVDSEQCLILPEVFSNEKCIDQGGYYDSTNVNSVITLFLECGTGSTELGSSFTLTVDNNNTNIASTYNINLLSPVTPSENHHLLTNYLNQLEDFRVLHMDYSPVERAYRIHLSFSYVDVLDFTDMYGRQFTITDEQEIYFNRIFTFDGINRTHPLQEFQWTNIPNAEVETDNVDDTYGYWFNSCESIDSFQFSWDNSAKLSLIKKDLTSDNEIYTLSFHQFYPNPTNALVSYDLTGNTRLVTTLDSDLSAAGVTRSDVNFVLYTNEVGWGYVNEVSLLEVTSRTFSESFCKPVIWGTSQRLFYIGDNVTVTPPAVKSQVCI